MKPSYNDLLGLADAELDPLDRALGSAVDAVLDSARINADDTIYLEKNADVSWASIAIASVECILAYSDDTALLAWFTKHGVRF